jgi:hypothetical protein
MLGISTTIIVLSLGVSIYSAAATAALGCIAKTVAGLIHSEIFNRIAKNA